MDISASKIAEFLGRDLIGGDLVINKPCSLTNVEPGAVLFAKKYSDNIIKQLDGINDILVIVTAEFERKCQFSHIISNNPRLDFARVLQQFFVNKVDSAIAETAIISPSAKIGQNVSVGNYTVIHDNVVIGDNTVIGDHIILNEGTHIGTGCSLKSHCVIGEDGFGFENDENGIPVRLPHLGHVRIGSHCEVGSFSTIMRGTLDDTVIEDNVKLDDGVILGHNVYIEENCMLTACIVGGSTRIRKGSFLATNCTLRNGIVIGENVLVGIGSTVVNSVEDGVIVAGNPAKVLRKR